ncbi:protein-(glutamine-N5) methyltransferase, release factor-specific [Candidatus Aerophobetes bacterium]|uniref:peptide chain release factor N(5)-glutamine methyltransferase n=1 Tax=Aerophobetes bacterium TaxID=2030807 RepID=A0A2A4YHE6_UNCAE|nr:MAG: protein-(glutamine-N5) methyltransferase, release factor-specific [Candidatus Aerophobetes bacterium]
MELRSHNLSPLKKQYLSDSLSKRDFFEIVAHVLNKGWQDLVHCPEESVSRDDFIKIEVLLEKKISGMPFARVLGYVDFYDARIELDENVLIPRPETEILFDKVLKRVSSRSISVVFDICTGSGCLGIAYKKKNPSCEVYLSDISKEALENAASNALLNQVNVSLIESDLLKYFPKELRADLVFCNPPYISKNEYASLDKSVHEHDPKLALIAEDNGLGVYKRLSLELPGYLSPGALVALEIGYMQKDSVKEIFSSSVWKEIICEKDFAGLDRFIFLELH